MAGGTRVTLTFPQEISYTPLREMVQKALDALEIKEVTFDLKNPDYQLGSDARYHEWTLETTLSQEQTESLLKRIQATIAETPVFPSSNQIGGKVAGDTQLMALYALVASMVIIVIYVWIRFQNVIFGLAAVLALLHDVLVTVAFLAMSYYLSPYLGFLQVDPFKISLSVLAALLTIIGFSINDTIVVFDRIREVRGKSTELTEQVINLSVNQTLSRTLLTSGTVFIASIILYFVGGPGIHGFAFSMVVGVIAGTYSSIYIAAPVLLWLRKPAAKPAEANRATAAAGGLSAKNR
jgi:SecD/SecF fusion protein